MDGTLLNDKGIISSYNLNALWHLNDSGVIIAIAIDNTMKAAKGIADYSTNDSKKMMM
ncbi:MAG: HAD hydrolase family protein [Solobacterium sp.]|jgi:hydroxymethylpyrimidine pyrophosphatase-like HAD family hydrolase|nr:HAD hydrolase family protein [Solobacterium sp.]